MLIKKVFPKQFTLCIALLMTAHVCIPLLPVDMHLLIVQSTKGFIFFFFKNEIYKYTCICAPFICTSYIIPHCDNTFSPLPKPPLLIHHHFPRDQVSGPCHWHIQIWPIILSTNQSTNLLNCWWVRTAKWMCVRMCVCVHSVWDFPSTYFATSYSIWIVM